MKDAVALVTFHMGHTVEEPEPTCDLPNLCGPACRYPRYYRNGPSGLVGNVLVELGYPSELLKALDCEYEIGEVLHPGVKIGRSRNPALNRVEPAALALLGFFQNSQKLGWSWNRIVEEALRPKSWFTRLDARRRPWLY